MVVPVGVSSWGLASENVTTLGCCSGLRELLVSIHGHLSSLEVHPAVAFRLRLLLQYPKSRGQRSSKISTYIRHIWHVLLHRSEHLHIVLISVSYSGVLHEISARRGSDLDLGATHLVVSWWSAHAV